jgi:E3 ubiquitin-protein ligase makorin
VDGIIASCDSTAGCGQFAAAGPPVAVDICDMCGHELPPTVDEQLRQKHTQECIRLHEEEMELSFAVQRSIEKVCGICMEVVWDKEPEKEARFGILSSCCHTFCLSCIRRWRAAQQFDKKTVKSCPECRVTSNFVVPSRYWVDEKDNKAKLIATYQSELSKKHCKYFNRGQGKCPFNDKCFYLHAYPDGRIASPRPVRRRVTSLQQPHRQHGDHAAQLHDGRGDDDEDHGDSTDLEGDDDGIFVVESASLYEIIEQLNERVTQLANQLENSFLYQLLQNNGLGATATSDDDDD